MLLLGWALVVLSPALWLPICWAWPLPVLALRGFLPSLTTCTLLVLYALLQIMSGSAL